MLAGTTGALPLGSCLVYSLILKMEVIRSSELHGIPTWKTVLFVATIARTSNAVQLFSTESDT
jgi:hypothetical protein